MPAPQERSTIKVQADRAILAAVRLPDSVYDQANPFGELRALAEQAGAIVVAELEQRKQKPESATYMGSGKVEELRDLCVAMDAQTVIFDHDLSPRQIGNIEEIVGRKILDRSELILDIFASRATTYEAKLQVELAQLQYTYPRLRAMWDHLERIVGVGGIAGVGTRGPGETQLETDRRLVQRRRLNLEHELAEIQARRRRAVQDRKKDHFTVGIVGYTNAGKSTLFNALTAGGAYADDRVFATLVTRTRDWNLGGGVSVMLSDTVGFVRDLPHNLVASFRATLEEATHADVLLIVLDVADPSAQLQYNTVIETLDELESQVEDIEADHENLPTRHARGETEGWRPPERVVLLNKADKLTDNRDLLVWQRKLPDAIAISALAIAEFASGTDTAEGAVAASSGGPLGLAPLRRRVLGSAMQGLVEAEVRVPVREGKAIQRLENRATVLHRDFSEDGLTMILRVRIGRRQLDQLKSTSANLSIQEVPLSLGLSQTDNAGEAENGSLDTPR